MYLFTPLKNVVLLQIIGAFQAIQIQGAGRQRKNVRITMVW